MMEHFNMLKCVFICARLDCFKMCCEMKDESSGQVIVALICVVHKTIVLNLHFYLQWHFYVIVLSI